MAEVDPEAEEARKELEDWRKRWDELTGLASALLVRYGPRVDCMRLCVQLDFSLVRRSVGR